MQWPWRKKEIELDRELAHHLDALTDNYRRQGYSGVEARRLARIDFGGVEGVKDECRELRWWSWISQIGRDIDFGFRMMRKTPGITLAALTTLALGIGATTAILTLANVVLWKSLAIPSPQQFYEVLWESKRRPDVFSDSTGNGFRDGAMEVGDFFSTAAFDAMRERASGNAIVASHALPYEVSANYAGTVAVVVMRAVSGDFFRATGSQPYLGRLLNTSDDTAAAAPSIVVTHGFWKRMLRGETAAVGNTIRVNNIVYEVVGVLPESFFGIEIGDRTDLYVPIRQSPQWLKEDSWYRKDSGNPRAWWQQVLLRANADVSPAELRAALESGFLVSMARTPTTAERTPHIRIANARNGLGQLRRELGNPMLILTGLVSLVLLVACANIANMLLARSVTREKELALRLSLGCSTGRLARQLFAESLLLALLGGVMSIPVSWGLIRVILSLMPEGFDRMMPAAAPDWRLLAATAMAAIGTAIVFGLYPAFRGARMNAAPALKEESGSARASSPKRWAPAKALVLIQTSLGVLLVTAAILFAGHLWEVVHRDTGFAKGNQILFDIRPGESGYNGQRLRNFYVEATRRLSAIPGVDHAAIARTRPMMGGGWWVNVRLPGETEGAQCGLHHVTDDFFPALGVPLLSGRYPTREEMLQGAKVAVISASLAKELKLGTAVGARVIFRASDGEREIIGVVSDARYATMADAPNVAYLPFDFESPAGTVIVHSSLPVAEMLRAVKETMREVDRAIPMANVYTMEQQISRTLQRERLFAWLCGSFGVLAFVLCMVGFFGLFSHMTARRRPEIGVRMALGASRRQVVRQVLGEGLRLVAVGLLAGIPLAIYSAWIAKSERLLPEGELAYWALGISLVALGISATLAILIPAIRASAVDPIKAIRQS